MDTSQLIAGAVILFGIISLIATFAFYFNGKENIALAIPFCFVVLVLFLATLL